MKKGQLLSQPFVIIFALVVMALILFFGYRAITGLLSTGEKVCDVKFSQDLQNEVNDLNTQPIGSSTKVSLVTCGGIKAICLVNLQNRLERDVPYKDIKNLINALEETNGKENVFFSSTTTKRLEPLTIQKLQVSKAVCDETLDGRFNMLLENKGRGIDAHK